MTEPDPYLEALAKTLRAEVMHTEETGFALLAGEFPGVELDSKWMQPPSGPGVTQYKAVWRGATVTAWSLADLRRQLQDVQAMLGTPGDPEGL